MSMYKKKIIDVYFRIEHKEMKKKIKGKTAPERLWFTITIKRHKKGKVCYCILSFSDFIVLVLGLFAANNYHLEQFCKSGVLVACC